MVLSRAYPSVSTWEVWIWDSAATIPIASPIYFLLNSRYGCSIFDPELNLKPRSSVCKWLFSYISKKP